MISSRDAGSDDRENVTAAVFYDCFERVLHFLLFIYSTNALCPFHYVTLFTLS